jgi:tetratricopeptide (TPR) repeat protein
MARDWDLFTITSVGLIPLAALVLRRFLSLAPRQVTSRVIVPGLVISIVLTVSWIGVNSSPERATQRYEHILSYDKTFMEYAYETLAKHYYDEGRLKKAITAMEEAVASSYNARLYIRLSVYYREDGRLLDAAGMLRPVLEQQPRYEKIRAEMALLLYRAGQYDEVLEIAGKGTEYHPENPLLHALYGRTLIRRGRIQEGAEELRELKRLNPPPDMLEDVDRILKQLKDEGKL